MKAIHYIFKSFHNLKSQNICMLQAKYTMLIV